MDIRITYLQDHPDAIPDLALIWHAVLGRTWRPNTSIECFEQTLKANLNNICLPITYVAFDGFKVVGGVSLLNNYIIRPDLKPWMGSLVIDPEYQNLGIGGMMLDIVKKKSIELGFEKLYIFVFEHSLIDYYQQRGFKTTGMDIVSGNQVTVMENVLSPQVDPVLHRPSKQ